MNYVYILPDIDKEYDDGYGGQELYGTIWYKDGTWSTRGEYSMKKVIPLNTIHLLIKINNMKTLTKLAIISLVLALLLFVTSLLICATAAIYPNTIGKDPMVESITLGIIFTAINFSLFSAICGTPPLIKLALE